MKYIAEIKNVDSGETHTLEGIESKSPQTAHKHLFMNVLSNTEEVHALYDENGHLVFESGKGFLC